MDYKEKVIELLKSKELSKEEKEKLENILPELKESEDERIRKALIRFHKSTIDVDGIKGDDILAWLEKQGEQKPQRMISAEAKESLLHDKYEGLTDFEGTLADICIGWIGQELGWKQYIKDNADVLLKIAIKMFNSVQDASFEQKPTDNDMVEALRTEYEKGRADAIAEMEKPTWSVEDEKMLHNIENCVHQCVIVIGTVNKVRYIDWLKSLKQRI